MQLSIIDVIVLKAAAWGVATYIMTTISGRLSFRAVGMGNSMDDIVAYVASRGALFVFVVAIMGYIIEEVVPWAS